MPPINVPAPLGAVMFAPPFELIVNVVPLPDIPAVIVCPETAVIPTEPAEFNVIVLDPLDHNVRAVLAAACTEFCKFAAVK